MEDEDMDTQEVPSKPANVKATPRSATSILVEWEKSSGDEGIKNYIVEYCKASDFPNFGEIEQFSGDACSALLDGLDRTTEYKVRVKAENGPYSDVVEVSTGAKVPDAPKLVEIKRGPEPFTSIFVKWDENIQDGGSSITRFVVEYHKTSEPSAKVVKLVGGDVFSKTLKALKPFCKYDVKVSAENEVGRSEQSTTQYGPLIGIRELAEDLDPVAINWRSLGIQLDVNVDNIDSEENRAGECLRKTLEAWKERGTATIGDIITALKSPAIGHNALAADLKQRGFNSLKLKDLLYVLRPIAANWHPFGIQLGVDYSKLATFTAFNSFVRRYLEIVLERWLGKDPPPKIQDIITALRQENNNRLAMQLEEKYQDFKNDPIR